MARCSIVTLQVLACILVTDRACAQVVLQRIHAQPQGYHVGCSVDWIGDLGGDGVPEYIVGTEAGYARVFDGATGAVVYALEGAELEDEFGAAVSDAGDVNADGVPDFVVGEPKWAANQNGAVYIHSGATGEIIYSRGFSSSVAAFGSAVDAAGDVNGDGYDDVIAGGPCFGGQPGYVRVYSGFDGSILHAWSGPASWSRFGTSVSGAGDVNGDGHPDLVVGTPLDPGGAENAGSIRFFSGLDGSLLRIVRGGAAGALLGISVDGIGDVDGDGFDDVVAGGTGSSGPGHVLVVSGDDGAIVHEIHGSGNERLGAWVSAAPDFDGDGTVDFAASSPAAGGGRVRYYSGASAAVLRTFASDTGDFGRSFATRSFDTDSLADLLAGAPFQATDGVSTGAAHIVRGFDSSEIRRVTWDTSHFELGSSISAGGDFDIDAKEDLVAGAGGAYDGDGAICLLPFQSAPVGYPIVRGTQGSAMGRNVAFVGDGDQDGRTEIALGEPLFDFSAQDIGRARVFSGTSHGIGWSRLGDSGDRLGSSIAALGDLNGDSINEVAVGVPYADWVALDAGAVDVCDGESGATLYSMTGRAAGDLFGSALATVGDLDGDGHRDLAIGAPLDDEAGADAGSIEVRSGASGALLVRILGERPGEQEGSALAAIGDVDGDGVDDWAAGTPFASSTGALAGRARVVSGATGSTLLVFQGEAPGDRFGTAICGPGDVDGDSVPDVLVGAPRSDLAGADAGAAYLFSGADGSLQMRLLGDAAGDRLGTALAGLGDLDGDARNELAVGAPLADAHGEDSGVVLIVALGCAQPRVVCAPKTNSLGCPTTIGWSGLPSLTSTSAFDVFASDVLNNEFGILFYGYQAGTQPFQGGVRCSSGPVRRTTIQNSGGSSHGTDCSGRFSFDFNAWIRSGVDAELVLGRRVFAQYWYRDPNDQTGFGSGLTNALEFVICP